MSSSKYQYSWEESVIWLREQSDRQELVRAAFYDDPLIDAAKRYEDSSEWKALRKLLAIKKGEALDIGAGRGISSYALAKDGWNVTALEPDPSDLVGSGAIRSLINESNVNIKVVEDWGEGLPFSDNSFDLVYCRAVLHHANDLGELCGEVFRVLKPNGLFVATREHVLSKKEDLEAFLNSHPLHHLYGGEHAYLLKEYLDAIKNAGFKVEQVLNPASSDVNLYPQTLKGMKKQISSRLSIPGFLLPDFLLKLRAGFSNQPGRHYSFVARKKSE